MQAAIVAESARGRQMIVRPSGHLMAADQPARVAEAIRGVVQAVRSGGNPSSSTPSPD